MSRAGSSGIWSPQAGSSWGQVKVLEPIPKPFISTLWGFSCQHTADSKQGPYRVGATEAGAFPGDNWSSVLGLQVSENSSLQ